MDLTALLVLVSATTCATLVHALARLFAQTSTTSSPFFTFSPRRPNFNSSRPPAGSKFGSSSSNSTRARHGFSLNQVSIFRSRTSHRRMFPRPHAFAYSYLLIGVPVRNEDALAALQGSRMPWWRRWWVRVDAQDHLHRDPNEYNLSRKLDRYLCEQDLEPSQFPFVYLVTSPRLFNYKFSPASFWYLYSANNELLYVIAEVNNTFDERRMYLLPQVEENIERDTYFGSGLSAAIRPQRLRHQWPKDFHVSPFSSRKGAYSFTTIDPALSDASCGSVAGEEGTEQQILRPPRKTVDITATLLSSKGYPKLIARLWSVDEPINVSEMSWFEAARLLAGWWWVGPITYPRIVCEAIKLAWTHKLEMWYRPEPNTLTVPRNASTSETYITQHLVSYLQHIVQASSDNFTLHCKFPVCAFESVTLCTPAATGSTTSQSFAITITTPRFLLQAVGTSRTLNELLKSTVLDPHPQNRMAEVTAGDSKHLIRLLAEAEELAIASSSHNLASRPWLFNLLSCARKRVSTAGVYPEGLPSYRGQIAGKDGNPAETSEIKQRSDTHYLDDFVRATCDGRQQRQYAIRASIALARSAVAQVTGGE